MAREIARKIENEMTYPGQIKVTVIREMRAVDYAKEQAVFVLVHRVVRGTSTSTIAITKHADSDFRRRRRASGAAGDPRYFAWTHRTRESRSCYCQRRQCRRRNGRRYKKAPKRLLSAGVNVLTSGNLSGKKKKFIRFWTQHETLIRPANFPARGHPAEAGVFGGTTSCGR